MKGVWVWNVYNETAEQAARLVAQTVFKGCAFTIGRPVVPKAIIGKVTVAQLEAWGYAGLYIAEADHEQALQALQALVKITPEQGADPGPRCMLQPRLL